jgi:hypothetical protein
MRGFPGVLGWRRNANTVGMFDNFSDGWISSNMITN